MAEKIFCFFDTNILNYRIKFFTGLNSNIHKPDDLKDLDLRYFPQTLKVTTSKYILRILLLEIVENLAKEYISVIEVNSQRFPSNIQ